MSEAKPESSTLIQFCRENPYTVVLFVLFVVAGAISAAFLPFGESLPLVRRVLAGAFIGAFFALFPVGARLFD